MEKNQKQKEQKLEENIFKIKTAHWVVFLNIKNRYKKRKHFKMFSFFMQDRIFS